jgi:Zn-dependent protease
MGLLDPTFSTGSSFLPSTEFILTQFIFINLILLLFNMIPIFPLDGEKVLEYFLPQNGQDTLLRIRPYGPMILFALIAFGRFGGLNILSILVGQPAQYILQLLLI